MCYNIGDMKKSVLLVSVLSFLFIGCNEPATPGEEVINPYGVFLGAEDNDFNKIKNYANIIIDVDEFSEDHIKAFKDSGVNVYAYLSVGSLEKYRDYYEDYKDITFMDYDNWPDERWVDVSNASWQSHISSEADRLKSLGATGIFMDNFDVFYVAQEEYECTDSFREGIYEGCKAILNDLGSKDLKLIINSGAEFLLQLNKDHIRFDDKIDVYAQECVFTKIINYKFDDFDSQDEEEKQYYQHFINLFKDNLDILLIEYTDYEQMVEEIKNYCLSNNFYYYISDNVDLRPTI